MQPVLETLSSTQLPSMLCGTSSYILLHMHVAAAGAAAERGAATDRKVL